MDATLSGGELLVLGDAPALRVRPIRPADRARLARGFGELGEQSRYRRFFSVSPVLSEAELDRLTELDHHDRDALGAEEVTTGRGVAVARYVRTADAPRCAELAITVLDDWQGRGVGRALVERLAGRARAAGVDRFRIEAQADNRAELRLLRRVGPLTLVDDRPDPGILVADLDLRDRPPAPLADGG